MILAGPARRVHFVIFDLNSVFQRPRCAPVTVGVRASGGRQSGAPPRDLLQQRTEPAMLWDVHLEEPDYEQKRRADIGKHRHEFIARRCRVPSLDSATDDDGPVDQAQGIHAQAAERATVMDRASKKSEETPLAPSHRLVPRSRSKHQRGVVTSTATVACTEQVQSRRSPRLKGKCRRLINYQTQDQESASTANEAREWDKAVRDTDWIVQGDSASSPDDYQYASSSDDYASSSDDSASSSDDFAGSSGDESPAESRELESLRTTTGSNGPKFVVGGKIVHKHRASRSER